MTTDNQYYKQIAEKLTGETISGVHTNNYYLNKICTSLGYTYSGVTCNGTYIKDFARHFTEQTYTKIHFNNYFLKKLAEHLTGETYGNHDDNYFLGLINENIIPQPPSFTSVEVTSDKSILSYTDSESATLTAQLMNGASTASVGGETVEFYRYVDGTNDVLVDSGQTDNNGVATGTYTSAGIGDIQVYAKVRSLVSKTFAIRDAVYYSPQSFTSNTVLSIPNMPVNFKALFTVTKNGTGNAWLEVGKDSDNLFFGGKIGASAMGIYKKVNGTQTNIGNAISNAFPSNQEYPIELTYEDGTITCKANGYTSTANYTLTDRDYVRLQIYVNPLSNLTILPL